MQKEDLFEKAAESLKLVTGIEVKKIKRKTDRLPESEGQVNLRAPQNPAAYLYNLSTARNLTNAALGNLIVTRGRQTPKTVLVTEYITPEQAENLRRHNMPFFDAAGNAYFNEPGLFVLMTGKKAKTEKERPLRLFRPVSLKVLFLLLGYPEYLNRDYRTIAEGAGVSLGAVSETFQDLRRSRYLLLPGNNERRLTRRDELLKKWVEAYTNKTRIEMRVGRFRTDKFPGNWWEKVQIGDYGAVWGGEIAAEKLTDHLKPESVTIYADSPIPQFQARFGLRRDENGNIEIIEKFWQLPETGETAHPLIVYADLIGTGDERNLETARIIYDNEIARLTGETAR